MRISLKWNTDSGDLEHGFRRSGTLVGAQRRCAVSVLPIGFATGARDAIRDSCSKSTTILPVERMGGVLCRPRRCGKRASTPVHSGASVSCAFSIPPVRSIGRPPPAGLLAAGVQAGVGMLMSSPACGSSGRGVSVASSGPSSRCDARRGAGGRRWRRPGWNRR